jgi:hypothetical protein
VLQARVVLNCTVAAGGALNGCQTESENPLGYGFGQGALALTDKVRVSIWSNEGLAVVGGKLRVPIRYDLKEAPASQPPSPSAIAKP